ncbi:MAG: hypothetical protein V2A78_09015 [bacterium]
MEVKINKNILLGILAALLAALLLIAFLLGRESKKETVLVQEQNFPATAPPAEVREVLTPPVQPFSAPSSSPAFFPQSRQTLKTPPALQFPPPPAGPTPFNAPAGAEQGTVRNYFQQMDDIGSSEEMSGDLNEMASIMVQGAFKGDFSSIDDLIARCRRLRGQVQALVVPPPCTEFHRKTLEVMDGSIRLYEELKTLIKGGDLSGLSRLTGQANSLKGAAKELENIQKEILSRYK